jgi:gas vesicle protein
MKDCKATKKKLVAFLYEELGTDEKERLKSHLESCRSCREELKHFRTVYRAADVVKEDIEDAMASVDWEALPSRIADAAFRKKVPTRRRSWTAGFSNLLLNPRMRPVYTGILIGVLLGSLATFLIFRPQSLRIARKGEFVVSQEFLEQVELEMARRQTVDYLAKSQYILLNFIRSSPEESMELWQSDLASRRAKDLLSMKKYINPQLEKFQMIKAKAICDQIELLFFELIQLSGELSLEELKKIQDLVQDKQLLLKIKLVKKELEKSEV